MSNPKHRGTIGEWFEMVDAVGGLEAWRSQTEPVAATSAELDELQREHRVGPIAPRVPAKYGPFLTIFGRYVTEVPDWRLLP